MAGSRTSTSPTGLELPIVVITAGQAWWKKPDIDRAWRDSHEAIANAGPHRRHVVAEGSDHDIPEMRPEVIVEAVLSIRAA